jgi:HD-GYP domain-containing protein (c-di-GMP phosphodiesterase class II)
MRKNAEIWYQDSSFISPLAESLRDLYCVRILPDKNPSVESIAASARIDVSHWGTREVPTVVLVELEQSNLMIFNHFGRSPNVRFIGFLIEQNKEEATLVDVSGGRHCFAVLSMNASRDLLLQTIEMALTNANLAQAGLDAHKARLHHGREEELNRIGIALSSMRDVGLLLEMILTKTREITRADAGSLYIVETSGSENGLSGRAEKQLRFKLIQNDSRQIPFTEHTLPLDEDSMAGYSALHAEVIALDDVYADLNRSYQFNAQYDEETGYRTRSLLTVPMKNARGEVLGVMQLLNCKRECTAHLLTLEDLERHVVPFPDDAIRLAESLASQAAIAYENSQLYQNIETLFEGFVQAAVTAIEQRDPTTSGHSSRVAAMTLGLAEAVNRMETGLYAHIHFTMEQMKEIRYAALLHDFGKIAVREEVLVKAQKLYPSQLAILQQRCYCLHQELETDRAQKKLEAVLAGGLENGFKEFAHIEAEYVRRHAELEEKLRFILEVNEATVLPRENAEKLMDISRITYRDPRGIRRSLLMPGEMASLSVLQGSLNDDERQEIESHVLHSFNFLMQIPWTPDLKFVPWIVRAHHEKLNGTGYPYNLRSEEIPLQAKMMIICDIFDALASADRPYKKAVTVDQALEILDMFIVKKELDSDLFRIFVESRVFEITIPASIVRNEHPLDSIRILD